MCLSDFWIWILFFIDSCFFLTNISLVDDCLSSFFKFTSSLLLHLFCLALVVLRSRGPVSCLLGWLRCGLSRLILLPFRFDVKNAEHLCLQRLLVLLQSVLLPGVVKDFTVKIVTSHAPLKQPNHVLVVRLLLEFERAAIFHEFLELAWLLVTKLLKRDLKFLLLDVSVLFILGAAG